MAEQYNHLTKDLQKFIENQKIFFVGTATSDGLINVSPKGLDSLKIINKNRILWMNLTGSGNESAAHTQENPRMTLMFTSFERKPLILRVYGKAKAIHRLDKEWDVLSSNFLESEGSRQIFDLTISLVQTSCGYAVPYYDFKGERDILKNWNEKAGEKGIQKYWKENNAKSLDGILTDIEKKNIKRS
tara:strand:+ start:74 stop:634 length:561 start_codon:yes stop_codon:yes gene_type:complete